MTTYAINWSGEVASMSGNVAVGSCVCRSINATHFVATTANRASYGRTVAVAVTAGSPSNPVIELIEAGIIPASVTGLGVGTVSWVRTSSTGTMERATPAAGDDIIGKARADGSVQFHPGVWDSDNTTGGGARHRINVKSDYGAVGDGVTDDTAAIQAAVTACTAANPAVELYFPSGSYLISSMITCGSPGSGFRMSGGSAYQTNGTQIKATAAMTACMRFPVPVVVEGIVFNANSVAKYAATTDSASTSRFQECMFVNATHDGLNIIMADAPILDNCTASGNGVVFCSGSGVAGQYDSYISGNAGHDMTTVVQSSTSQAITLTVDADQHTVTATAASGTIDFTTLGLRYGDVIRFNGGSSGTPDGTARFFQLTQVLAAGTLMIAGNLRLATAGAYTDWAISRGDGVRNAGPTANNSQLIVRGGLYMFNAGSGIAIPGAGIDEHGGAANYIFGLSVDGVDPQYNGAAGVLVGQATCNVQPATLVGKTFSVTNGSASVTASASVSGLIAAGAFFYFLSQSSVVYHVQSVAGAVITLTAVYTGTTSAATTIAIDVIGCAATNLGVRNFYEENNAAGAFVLSNCQAVEIDAVFGGNFPSAVPDILTDSADVIVKGSAFCAGGVKGVGGFATRSASEEIALGSAFSSVPQASLQNWRTGYQQQPNSSIDPAVAIDSTRSYQWCYLVADVLMTATPSIAAPSISRPPTTSASQVMYVQNAPQSTKSLTFQDNATLVGSNLSLHSPVVTVPPGGFLILMWDESGVGGGMWQEMTRGGCTDHLSAFAVPVLDIDWSRADVFTKTLAAGANTFTFSNTAPGMVRRVEVTGAASTLTWPAGIRTAAGVGMPVQTASGTDVYTLTCTALGITATWTQNTS